MDVVKDVNAGWWLLLKNASKMTQSTGQAEKIRILGSFLGLSWARIGCELLLERQIFLLPREHSREEDGPECPRFSESQDGLRMLCVSWRWPRGGKHGLRVSGDPRVHRASASSTGGALSGWDRLGASPLGNRQCTPFPANVNPPPHPENINAPMPKGRRRIADGKRRRLPRKKSTLAPYRSRWITSPPSGAP